MDWLDNLQKAINYIEEHLLEDEMITDMNISHEIYSSTDSFRTIFRVITGYSVGEYIRNRRLSLSGEELIQSGHTILDIALKYGYDTPEGFTKAFSRFHGVTPSYVRKNQTGLRTFTRVQLKIQAVVEAHWIILWRSWKVYALWDMKESFLIMDWKIIT